MTTDPPVVVTGDDATVQPGRQVLVTGAPRQPRPRGLGTVVLAIVVAMLCAYVAVLLIGGHHRDAQISQLACQVQRLGGQPVGGVDCPKPTPSATPTPGVAPRPTVIVVQPSGPTVVIRPMPQPASSPARSPAPARNGASPAASARPPATSSPRPSPSPTCRTLHNPLTGRCVLLR